MDGLSSPTAPLPGTSPQRPPTRDRDQEVGARATFSALAFYGVATALVFLPFGERLWGRVLGDGSGDEFQFLWNFWWLREALERGENPLFTDLLFWPEGTPLVYHTLSPGNGILSLPIQYLWPGTPGLVASLNLTVLLSFALTGLATWLLARTLRVPGGWALLAGVLVSFSPYRLWHISHVNLLSTWQALLALAFLLDGLGRGRTPSAVLAGLFLAWTGWSDYETAVQLGLVLAGATALHHGGLLGGPVPPLPVRLRILGACGLVAGILLAPLMAAVVAIPPSSVSPTSESEVAHYSANLAGIFLPPGSSLLWGALPPADTFPGHGLGVEEVALGPLLLLSALGALFHRPARPWLALALPFLVLALGPSLHLGPHTSLEGLLPYRWLQDLPALGQARCPVRYLAMVHPLLALAVAGMLARVAEHPRWRAVAWLMAIALVAERLPRSPPVMTPTPVPEAVLDLARWHQQDPRAPGTALMPLPNLPRHERYYMFWQTVHHLPMAVGYTARQDMGALAWLTRFQAASEADRLGLLQEARFAWILEAPADPDRVLSSNPVLRRVPEAPSQEKEP